MLRRVGPLRHAIVGVTVAGMATLATVGVIGAGDGGLLRPEHFDAKQVTVSPAGGEFPDGLRIREVIDIDFGNRERRGYEREIPNDFGEATDVSAFSPDANDEVNVVQLGSRTRIRVGNPSITFTGRHRYVLEYVLPDAGVTTGRLALDVIGTDETFRTDRFEVVLVGFDGLDDLECATGTSGAFGGCEFAEVDGRRVAVIEPLDPREGISVFGAFRAADPSPDVPPVPPVPDRGSLVNWTLGLAVVVLGTATAGSVHAWMRRRGSNVVFGEGGATDAALGVPLPNPGMPVHDVVTHRVPDDRLADYATIEFVPPRGLEPWQGAALLQERIDDVTVRSWFGEMIARGAITTSGEGNEMELHRGPVDATLSERDQKLLRELFRYGDPVPLGTYRTSFATLWSSIREEQSAMVDAAGWWERPIASSGARSSIGSVLFLVVMLFVAFAGVLAPLVLAASAFVRTWWSALALSILVIAAVAALCYRSMLASRTALGSALTLRTESFRRFLVASEGRHVDWAWEQGVLREYSAWAVALGAADAWSSAIRSSSVPERDTYLAGPLLMHSNISAFSSTRTAPSSSGSGGGGFSGGSVGGGGGGGSSGSW